MVQEEILKKGYSINHLIMLLELSTRRDLIQRDRLWVDKFQNLLDTLEGVTNRKYLYLHDEIINTKDVLPPLANLEFIEDAIEEVYQNQRAYKGSIKNNGLKRADFVRVIYTLHDENSNLITTDSAFISGSKQIFNSGIISDASINPGEFAEFYVVIETTSEKEIKYFLRDVRWEYFK